MITFPDIQTQNPLLTLLPPALYHRKTVWPPLGLTISPLCSPYWPIKVRFLRLLLGFYYLWLLLPLSFNLTPCHLPYEPDSLHNNQHTAHHSHNLGTFIAGCYQIKAAVPDKYRDDREPTAVT